MHSMSMLNHGSNNNTSAISASPYVTMSAGGIVVSSQVSGLALGINSQFSTAGHNKADGNSNNTMLLNDGPPTPTQEMDMVGDHRKCKYTLLVLYCYILNKNRFSFTVDNNSASLNSLQGVVTSTQGLRSQGPSLTPSLANYFRADLIEHVKNWPADLLEKQVSEMHSNK